MSRAPRDPARRDYSSSPSKTKRTTVVIRMPPDLAKRLYDLAQAGFRSRNAEILMRIEYAIDVDHQVIVAHRLAKANEIEAGGRA